MPQRHCLIVDLQDDAAAIGQYEKIHQPGGVWPEVIQDLRANGYREMTIWRWGNRLTMIVEREAGNASTPPDESRQDILERWDVLTKRLQQALPGTGPSPTWVEMRCVFDLKDH